MIPKIIHYCWFGRQEKPELVKMCIASWREHLPEYSIKEWNETNSPKPAWVCAALKHHKWAFAADYVRFYALYEQGGIYMDTDMLLLKPLTHFENDQYFIGMQDAYSINLAIAGCVPHHPFNKHAVLV